MPECSWSWTFCNKSRTFIYNLHIRTVSSDIMFQSWAHLSENVIWLKSYSKIWLQACKTTVLWKCLASSLQDHITGNLKSRPFALATYGSNDKTCVKFHPIAIMYFFENEDRILTMILSMLECTGSTIVGILKIINEEFRSKKYSLVELCNICFRWTGTFKMWFHP